MPLQPKLNKFTTAQQAITTFPYTDLAEGTGISVFNLAKGIDSAGTDYILTKDNVYSYSENGDGAYINGSLGGTAYTFNLSEFNMPKDINGHGYVNLLYGVHGGTAGAYSIQVTGVLQKWDGISATTIATATSAIISVVTNGEKWGALLLDFNTIQTHFATGDQLRLVLTVTSGNPSGIGGSYFASVFIDPAGRSITIGARTFTETNSNIAVPFNIEASV